MTFMVPNPAVKRDCAEAHSPLLYYKGFPTKVKQIPTGVESRMRLTPEHLT